MTYTTNEIIKNCFKKARMEFVKDDRAKFLFRLLCDEMDKRFHQVKKKEQESYLADLISQGWTLDLGTDKTIQSSGGNYDYNGEKEFIVTDNYKSPRGFNTIKGAMKYIEDSQF